MVLNMAKNALDMDMGANVTRLRTQKGLSMSAVVAKMNAKGHKWTKTTLFHVEHNSRKLQAAEAYDLLSVLGYDPEIDLPQLYRTVDQTEIDDLADECQRRAETLQDDWNQYLYSKQYAAERIHTYEESDSISKQQGEELLHRLSSWEGSLKDAIEEGRTENGAHLITWQPYRRGSDNVADDSDNQASPQEQ